MKLFGIRFVGATHETALTLGLTAAVIRVVITLRLPAFLGNSVGGVALVAALAHAQHAPE